MLCGKRLQRSEWKIKKHKKLSIKAKVLQKKKKSKKIKKMIELVPTVEKYFIAIIQEGWTEFLKKDFLT